MMRTLATTLLGLLTTGAAAAQSGAEPGAQPGSQQRPDDEMVARRQHWAWQPLRDVAPAGDGHPVDAFVRARLRDADLSPSEKAPAHQRLRRLWFDLVGLPPTPEAVARFHEVQENLLAVRDARADSDLAVDNAVQSVAGIALAEDHLAF